MYRPPGGPPLFILSGPEITLLSGLAGVLINKMIEDSVCDVVEKESEERSGMLHGKGKGVIRHHIFPIGDVCRDSGMVDVEERSSCFLLDMQCIPRTLLDWFHMAKSPSWTREEVEDRAHPVPHDVRRVQRIQVGSFSYDSLHPVLLLWTRDPTFRKPKVRQLAWNSGVQPMSTRLFDWGRVSDLFHFVRGQELQDHEGMSKGAM